MNLTDIPNILRDSFEQTPEVLGGKLRVRGTRISVEQVLELEAHLGATPAHLDVFPIDDLVEHAVQLEGESLTQISRADHRLLRVGVAGLPPW